MAQWDQDTRVEGSGGRYHARLSEEWAVWGPNGGYRAAIALRAIGAEAGLPRPASFHCHFLAAGKFAPVDLEVLPLVRRKRAEAWHCVMSQDGERLLETSAWVVDADLAGYEHLDATPPDVPGPEALQGYQDLADNYDEWYPIWRSVEGRPVDWGRDTGPPRWHTWLRFFDTPPLDEPFLEASRSVMTDALIRAEPGSTAASRACRRLRSAGLVVARPGAHEVEGGERDAEGDAAAA
jgi:hypothetical protein